jgi:hypothetical protein
LISFRAVLFQKHDMSPGRRAERAGVIVRISRPREAVIRHLIPFFARDLASFAADANSRIGQEPHFYVILHEGMSSLVRALQSFADHRLSIFPSMP